MQIASLSVHPWKFIGRKSKVQLSIIVCFTGTALQVSSSATLWLIAKFTMTKVCLCTSQPAMKRLDSLTRGWIWWRELWEKGDRETWKNASRCCRSRTKHPDKKHSQWRGLSSKSRPAHKVCLSRPLTCTLRRRESSSSRCFFYSHSGPPRRPSRRPDSSLKKKRRGVCVCRGGA